MTTAHVRTLAISASSRFYDDARALAARLEQEGLAVRTPRFDLPETPDGLDAETKQHLTLEFLEHVAHADALYVLAPGGYVGMSVAVEVGFASALGKPVFISEVTSEEAVNVLATAILACDAVSRTTLCADGAR